MELHIKLWLVIITLVLIIISLGIYTLRMHKSRTKQLKHKILVTKAQMLNTRLVEEHVIYGNFFHIVFSMVEEVFNPEHPLSLIRHQLRFLKGIVIQRQRYMRDTLFRDYIPYNDLNNFDHILKCYLKYSMDTSSLKVVFTQEDNLDYSTIENQVELAELCIEFLRNIYYTTESENINIHVSKVKDTLQIAFVFKGSAFGFIKDKIKPAPLKKLHPDHDPTITRDVIEGMEGEEFQPVKYLGLELLDRRLKAMQVKLTLGYKRQVNKITLEKKFPSSGK